MHSEHHIQRLQRLNGILLLAFLAVALALIFWGVMRSRAILAREDNPRLVEAELRIQRGRILDKDEAILAETVGPPGRLERRYPQPAAEPVIGYYSLRHGTAGIEEGMDAILRGESDSALAEAQRQLTHAPQIGRDVRLTLDISLQQAAADLLGHRQGAVVLLSLPDGAIRALVSAPSYDPNALDARFDALVEDEDAPLLNRATQGRYQPGMALQPFVLAAALEQDLIRLDSPVENAEAAVAINSDQLTCVFPLPDGETQTWADVLQTVCPAPMRSLAGALGGAEIQAMLDQLGFDAMPEMPIAVAEPESVPVVDPALALVGQDTRTVTPLQMAVALSLLGRDGVPAEPQLVAAVQDTAGNWQSQIDTAGEATPRAVGSTAVQAVVAQLPRHELFVEHTALALSGPDESTNVWYLGLAPASAPRFAIVVIVEEEKNVDVAQRIGRGVLTAVLSN